MKSSPLESIEAFNEYAAHRIEENKTPIVTKEYFVVPVPLYKTVETPRGSGIMVRTYLGYSEVKVSISVDWRMLAVELATKASKNRKKRASGMNGAIAAIIVS